MKNISPKLAEILGLLCAEGSYVLAYSSYWGKERCKPRYYKNKKSERIEFSNEDQKLLMHFQTLVSLEFGFRPNITKHNKINLCRNEIIRAILSHTRLGHLSWQVPASVQNGSCDVKEAFIRGFFDGDGTASKEIRFFSTNEKGLTQLSGILSNLGWKNYMLKPQIKPNRKPLFTIQLLSKEKENFLKQIKPISKHPGLCEGSH